MKIAVDADGLVRAITDDDERQSTEAREQLTDVDMVAFTIPAQYELVWGLSRIPSLLYGVGPCA